MSSQQLIADLDVAVTAGSAEHRVEMLRRVTDLFLADADRLNDQQLGVFDDVLVRMIERVEAKALAQLSTALAPVEAAPQQAVTRLAWHEAIAVAGPVLRDSTGISNADLIAIARERGQDHLLAISGRRTINAEVTDVLIERGDTRVTRRLAGNAGAEFSRTGYDTMVKRAEADETLAETLGLRLDLPLQLLKQLLARATEAVRAKLLAVASPEVRAQIEAVLGKLAEEFGRIKPKPTQYSDAEQQVLALNRDGKLSDRTINQFVLENQTAHFVVAIALRCAVKPDTIEPLMLNARSEGLVVACRAAGLNWETARAILTNRFPGIQPTPAQTDEAHVAFEALSRASAQRTIRFWAARSAAKSPA